MRMVYKRLVWCIDAALLFGSMCIMPIMYGMCDVKSAWRHRKGCTGRSNSSYRIALEMPNGHDEVLNIIGK